MGVGGANLVGIEIRVGTNVGAAVGVAVGGGGKRVGVFAKPGAGRSEGVGGSDCSGKGEFG